MYIIKYQNLYFKINKNENNPLIFGKVSPFNKIKFSTLAQYFDFIYDTQASLFIKNRYLNDDTLNQINQLKPSQLKNNSDFYNLCLNLSSFIPSKSILSFNNGKFIVITKDIDISFIKTLQNDNINIINKKEIYLNTHNKLFEKKDNKLVIFCAQCIEYKNFETFNLKIDNHIKINKNNLKYENIYKKLNLTFFENNHLLKSIN